MRRAFAAFRLISLAALVIASVIAPAAVSAAPKDREVEVLFVSRAELEAAGLITSDAVGPMPQHGCLFDCIYADNKVFTGTTNVYVTKVSGPGPATMSLDVQYAVSNSFSASVSIGADKVSAEMGFSVTWSASQTYKYSVNVPSGACWTIRAYNVFNTYKFEVWNHALIGPDSKLGTGTARRFMGVKYTLAKSC